MNGGTGRDRARRGHREGDPLHPGEDAREGRHVARGDLPAPWWAMDGSVRDCQSDLSDNEHVACRASSGFFRDVQGRARHMVIASSYAALNPSHTLWREYLEEISRRRDQGEISDEEYHFLRSSREARQALMDETLGDEDAFSAGTLDEVLAHAKEQIQAEAKAETEAERAEKLAAQEEARTSRAIAGNRSTASIAMRSTSMRELQARLPAVASACSSARLSSWARSPRFPACPCSTSRC